MWEKERDIDVTATPTGSLPHMLHAMKEGGIRPAIQACAFDQETNMQLYGG